jgi:hypothetical protein
MESGRTIAMVRGRDNDEGGSKTMAKARKQGDGEMVAQRRGREGRTMAMLAGRYGRDDADGDKRSFRIEIRLFIVELRSLYSQIERSIVKLISLTKLISWGYFPSLGGLSQEEPFYACVIRFIPPLYILFHCAIRLRYQFSVI